LTAVLIDLDDQVWLLSVSYNHWMDWITASVIVQIHVIYEVNSQLNASLNKRILPC